MQIAVLNRNKLQEFADERIAEAKVLLDAGKFTGAYYLTGLGVECALKACLASAVQQFDFPDKDFIVQAYTHNLNKLTDLDGSLSTALRSEIESDPSLRSNWNTVRLWKDSNRYSVVSEREARALFEAATQESVGVMDWIRRRW